MPKYIMTQSYLNFIASELDAFLMMTDHRYLDRNEKVKRSERISDIIIGLSNPSYIKNVRSEIKYWYDRKVYDGLTYKVSGGRRAVKEDAEFLMDALSKMLM